MGPNRPVGSEYRALLATLFSFLVAYPVLRTPAGSPVLAQVLLTAVFLTGGWVVFAACRLRLLAALLGGLAVLGAWTGYTLPEGHGRAVTAGFHVAAAAFQLLVVAVVLGRVYQAQAVSTDAVAAALCVYLLFGIAFGHVYCLASVAVPNSFRGLEPGVGGPEAHVQLTYFSFMTLTTVGYGDIIPAIDATRSLALAEGVAGQFYLAVLIADLVGKRVAQSLSSNPP